MPVYNILVYSFSFICMLVIGVFVFLKDTKSAVNRSFFFFTFAIISWMFFMFSGYSRVPDDLPGALLFFRFAYGFSVLALSSLVLFFYYFPHKASFFSEKIVKLNLVISLILCLIGSFTDLIEAGVYMENSVQMDRFGVLYGPYLIFCLLQIFLTFYLAFKNLFILQGVERKKLIYVSFGFFIFALLATITNAILPFFGIFILQNESVTFSLFFFVSVFYSIYKQRFFHFSYLSLHFIRKLILFFSLFFLVWAIRAIYQYFDLPANKIISYSFFTIVLFFSYPFLEKVFPDLYSPKFREFKRTISETKTHILDCKSFQELLELLKYTFVQKLSLRKVELYFISENKVSEEIPIYSEDALTEQLKKTKDVLVREEVKNIEVQNRLKALKCHICLPLFSNKKLIAFLALDIGAKKNLLSREELDELVKIRRNLETSFMNILITNTLAKENDLMKRIISEHTHNLQSTNRKLKKLVSQQQNFISLAAHEFRTPLTVAMLGLESISFIHGNSVSQKVLSDIKVSYEQLDKLTYLINRLLEMRQIENGKVPVHLEKIDLVQFLQTVVENMSVLSKEKNVIVEFHNLSQKKQLSFFTDQIKLRATLENLIQNALKFSPKGAKIRLELAVDVIKNEVILKVIDNGPGISPEDLKIIFDKFQQGSQNSKGIGIGLFLCKKYVKLLHGRILAQSTLGEGATFTVRLPLQ